MMSFIPRLLGRRKKAENTEKSFSEFFITASEKEKTELLRRVVKEANEDQKKMMHEAREIINNRAVQS